MSEYFEKIVDTVNGNETIIPLEGERLEVYLRDKFNTETEINKIKEEEMFRNEQIKKISEKLNLSKEDVDILFGRGV